MSSQSQEHRPDQIPYHSCYRWVAIHLIISLVLAVEEKIQIILRQNFWIQIICLSSRYRQFQIIENFVGVIWFRPSFSRALSRMDFPMKRFKCIIQKLYVDFFLDLYRSKNPTSSLPHSASAKSISVYLKIFNN